MHNAPLNLGGWVEGDGSNVFPPGGGAEPSEGRAVIGIRPTSGPDELRLVTALFADIVGSTALGEFLAIEEVQALVGECITRVCEAIERHGGVIGAYMGDGVAAFFGLEAADESDHTRAALAALEVRDVVSEYAREARSAWGVDDLNVRVGINCGRVATGSVGARDPKVLALGDAVNVAARLQALAEPGSIVIGRSVAQALEGRFELHAIGPVRLRGREEPVEAHLLLAEARTRLIHERLPIVGREEELARLQARLSDLGAGRGQVIVMLGEAGIGKSRLLDAMRRRASGVIWLGVGTSQADRRMPYEPFVSALRSWLSLPPGAADLAARIRLHARLSNTFGPGVEELLAPLGRLLGLPPRTKADRRLEGLPVDVLRGSLHRAYREWLVGLARTAPVVLAMDNFNRVDEATVQLGEELLSITDVAPVLFAVTMRVDPGAPGWRVRVRALSEYAHRSDELRLQPLSEEDGSALVKALDVDVALTADVRTALVRKAEGNPLYIEELFNAIAGQGMDNDRDEVEALPPPLESLLVSRIDRLPVQAREVLQAAAILGRDFSKRALQIMEPVADLDDILRALLRADLIRERRRDPREFTFKHGLLRNAALSTLTKQKRRTLHGRAAGALEETCGSSLREYAPALAWHYLASGDLANGAKFLEDLGDRLATLYRYDHAAEVLDECRTYLRERGSEEGHTRVTEKLAEVLARAGDSEGATRLLDELLSAANQAQAKRLLMLKAQLALQAGRLDEALASLEGCTDGAVGPDLEYQALALSAQIALRMGDLAQARALLERLGPIEEVSAEAAVDAASVWAGYLAASGDFIAARGWGERAVELAHRVGRLSGELRAQRHLGVLEVLNGRISNGHALLRHAFDTSMDLSFPVGALESGINLIHSACLLGHLEEAESVGELMLRLTDSPFWEAMVRSNLATTRFERNDLEGARAAAERVLELGVEVTTIAPRIAARLALIRVHTAEQLWERADEEALAADQEVGVLGGREGLVTSVRTAIGELALARGDAEAAARLAEEALERDQYAEKPVHLALLRLKGMALAQLSVDEALAILDDVQNMSRVMEMQLEEGRTLVAIGACSASDAAFSEAEAIFNACGCERGLVEVAQARHQLMRA